MAEAALSATETALENQRIGGLQIRVAALCTLIQICDGYDINSVAWAVPSLTHVWSLPGPAFTTAFLWSSIGILVGALSAGPIGCVTGLSWRIGATSFIGVLPCSAVAAGCHQKIMRSLTNMN